MGSDVVHANHLFGQINFNPRSPCGERPVFGEYDTNVEVFQSTLPVWGATQTGAVLPDIRGISIHAPRVGSDWAKGGIPIRPLEFQSTLPVWGATGSVAQLTKEGEFQSTLPVWGATVLQRLQSPRYRNFNPRSPCGERRLRRRFRWRWVNFNPRSPCGERLLLRDQGVPGEAFQSTLPVWGATTCWLHRPFIQVISIHAPRVGSDLNAIPNGIFPPEFQSTLPVWGATAYTPLLANGRTDFNPRSPCGERHSLQHLHLLRAQFQSTLPVWGATACTHGIICWSRDFNPRSPCGERPCYPARIFLSGINFNPRSPCGERLQRSQCSLSSCAISIHAPRVGSDRQICRG